MSAHDFKNRLQSLINREPSVNAFAKKCECTEGALRSYLIGKSLPGLDKLLKIAEAAGVSVQWLATGEGEMQVTLPVMVSDRPEGFQPIVIDADRRQSVLVSKLQRILDEGDKTKVDAVKGMLKAFDPGEKKPGSTHEEDGAGGNLDSRVA